MRLAAIRSQILISAQKGSFANIIANGNKGLSSRGSRFDTLSTHLSEACWHQCVGHRKNVSDIAKMCRETSCVSHIFPVCVCVCVESCQS